VQVTDLLPTGLAFVSATPSQGTYNNTTGVWTVGTVTTAMPQTLQIQARVLSPNPQTNTATISGADQPDSNPNYNTASAPEPPHRPPLETTNTVTTATPTIADPAPHVVPMTTPAPDPPTNVQVRDQLPAGVTFVSAQPSQGSYNPNTGVWTVGTLAVNVRA